MKVLNLRSIYLKMKRHILLVESYTEHKGMSSLIKMCRLKPHALFVKKTSKLELYKWWIDEFGNSLKIIKNKKIAITMNDLFVDRKYLTSTDPYHNLSLHNTLKISKILYLCHGTDEDMEVYYIAFLGIDDYLRCFMINNGELIKISPLVLGVKNLNNIVQNCNSRSFKKFKIKDNSPPACKGSVGWLSSIPLSAAFFKALERQYGTVVSFLNPIQKENTNTNVR